MSEPIIVLKFGGSVLSSEGDLLRAVNEVYRFHRRGIGVVAVVSAFCGTTDRLLASGHASGSDDAQLAELLASGERDAAAALARALFVHGVPARSFDPTTLRLETRGPRLDAEPSTIDLSAIENAIARGFVAIVPGFFGSCERGGIALLGRGGSDLSALFVASRLRARCRLVKDVPSLFEWDPAAPGPSRPRAYADVTFGTAQRIGGRILQHKAIAFARRHDLRFEIGTWNSNSPTLVGAERDRFHCVPTRTRINVVLLGHGTVGRAVREALDALPESFELTRILVRDKSRHDFDPRIGLDASAIDPTTCDVVVEAIGGVEPAFSLTSALLARGVDVVTANKTLLAVHGAELADIALESGSRLLASACVGGATPVLETANRLGGRLRRLEGVLNGTSAYVTHLLARGRSLEQALRSAQHYGLAESDSTKDLRGHDAAEKLAVLARAVGVEIGGVSIEDVDLERSMRDARDRGATLAQFGVLEQSAGTWRATVRWREQDPVPVESDPEPTARSLGRAARARAHGVAKARNTIDFELDDGRHVRIHGVGAGGTPTATAIVADLLDLARRSDSDPLDEDDFVGTISRRGPRRSSRRGGLLPVSDGTDDGSGGPNRESFRRTME